MSLPFKKNDDVSVEITGLTAEGAGIGRAEGAAVFVNGALPGERVRVHIIKTAASYAVGKLVEVETPSPVRTDPLCPVFSKCGGCSLQHMEYQAQLEVKRETVKNALERIGGFKGVEVEPTIGMDEPWGYRNKGSFPFGFSDGKAFYGLYAARSHRLADASNCAIERPEALAACRAAAEWANRFIVPVYSEETHKGVLRHVVTRVMTGGVCVVIVTTGSLPHKEELIRLLQDNVKGLVSVYHNVNPRATNVICGEEYRLIWGADKVVHSLNGLEFAVSPESFLQVNTLQTEKLYSLVCRELALGGNEIVADVFCGIGTISLLLAGSAKKVVGIEYVSRAVEDARHNARLNGIENAEFYAGPAEALLPRLVEEGSVFDAVVLDPPRKGADEAVLRAIAKSGARKVVYVSCDPATLARDLKLLAEFGYTLQSVHPVDMFPMTGHVETVVLMTRNA